MIVIYGTKATHTELGRVADFCLVCRDITPFKLMEVGVAGHIFWIPLGSGSPVAYEGRCENCGLPIKTHPRRYRRVSEDDALSIEDLSQEYGPTHSESLRQPLELSEKVRSGTLSATERKKLIADSFLLLNELVKVRRMRVKLDVKGAPGCSPTLWVLGALVLLYVGADYLTFLKPLTASMNFLHVALGILIAGTLLTVVVIATDTRRFVRKELLPKLIRALEPLDLTQEEAQQWLAQFRKLNYTLAKNVSVADLKPACVD